MELDLDEALRYLGVPAPAPAELREQVRGIARELTAVLQPRWTWRVYPLSRREGDLVLAGTDILLSGATARTMLAQCRSAAVLACTLGAEFDALLRTRQARDMSEAVILDACGSALTEAGCDAAQKEIAGRLPGKFLTDRFSPGYGDLPLNLQSALCSLLDAPRRLGLTVTDSCLLNPGKSVTAVVGLSDTPQPARVRGCAHCSMAETCQLRKDGGGCAGGAAPGPLPAFLEKSGAKNF